MSNPPDAYEDQLPHPLPIPPVRTTGDKVTPLTRSIRVHMASMARVIDALGREETTEYQDDLLTLLNAGVVNIEEKLAEMEGLR